VNKFQITYILVFLFSLIGIAGNFELEIATALHCWLILITSGVLTVGKIIFLERRRYGRRKDFKVI